MTALEHSAPFAAAALRPATLRGVADAAGGPEHGAGPLVVVADGVPQGQGRISYNKGGHGYYSNANKLKPWRTAVRDAALALYGLHEWAGRDKGPCRVCGTPQSIHALFPVGAVWLEAVCVFPPLKSDPGRLYPTTRSASDWDHLGRAIGDALTGVLWADDSQIVDGHVRALYSSHPESPLGDPGVLIWADQI